MRQTLLYIGFILFGFSCSNTDHEIIVDSMVEDAIVTDFNTIDEELWGFVEGEFYNSMKRVNVFDKQDTIKSIHKLNNLINAAGYHPDLFINVADVVNKENISNLQKLGVKIGDGCAKNYVYKIIEPIVSNYEEKNDIVLDTTNLIKTITLYYSDSSSICNFHIFVHELEDENRLQRFWNKPGTRKIVLLAYFSEMIDKDF